MKMRFLLPLVFLCSCGTANSPSSVPMPGQNQGVTSKSNCPRETIYDDGQCWRGIVVNEKSVRLEYGPSTKYLYREGQGNVGPFAFDLKKYENEPMYYAMITLCGRLLPNVPALERYCKTTLTNNEYAVHNSDGDLIFTFNPDESFRPSERRIVGFRFQPK